MKSYLKPKIKAMTLEARELKREEQQHNENMTLFSGGEERIEKERTAFLKLNEELYEEYMTAVKEECDSEEDLVLASKHGKEFLEGTNDAANKQFDRMLRRLAKANDRDARIDYHTRRAQKYHIMRTFTLRRESRYVHLAHAHLRGVPYNVVERDTKTKHEIDVVDLTVAIYGTRTKDRIELVSNWLDAE